MTSTEERRPTDIYEAELMISVAKKMMKTLKFPIYVSDKLYNTDLDVLDLTTRGMNGLKRNKIGTVGELVDFVDSPDKLMKIRGMGKKTADEILHRLYLYQYSILPEDRKGDYLYKVMELNGMC